MKKTTVVLVACLLVAIFIASYFLLFAYSKTTLKIFHAGSLTLTLQEAEQVYERSHPRIDIQREPSGSVKAVRKITDLGRKCDIVFSADYKVIGEYLMPKYAKWLVIFCSNEIVLCYTDKSKYANEITEKNWLEILMKPGVKYGFSNPNLDPCGYRALAVLYLAPRYYKMEEAWSELVLKYIRNVKVNVSDGEHYILFPASLDYATGGKLVLRDKSVDLIQLLEAGVIDYAFEYRSVAEEHGLKYIRLPPELNLVKDPFLSVYVVLYTGDAKRQRTVKISSIKYGFTIPTVCEHYEEALKFLKWFLYGDGKEILEKHGFTVIPYEFKGAVPDGLRRGG